MSRTHRTLIHLILPLGLSHRVIQDDVYKGVRIPKGAAVVANLWAILHDERAYPDPFSFNPDRFDHQDLDKNINGDPRRTMFGFGKRCVNIKL